LETLRILKDTDMKKKTKIIILICAIAAAAVVVILLLRSNAAAAADGAVVQTKTLSLVTLADTVSVTGTAESTGSTEVFSPLPALSVRNVFVEVGDRVNAGDVLCELNTDGLENNIAQSRAQIHTANAASAETVAANQMKYDNAVYNLNYGLNAQVNTANAAAGNAVTARDRANAALGAAQTAMGVAGAARDQAQIDYDANLDPDNEDALAASLAEAQTAFTKAAAAVNTAATAAGDAETAYQNALAQCSITLNAANQEIETLRKAVGSSQVAANNGTAAQEIALKELQAQLEQATITAPAGGTVTEVRALAGGASSGVLFVIENTGDLQITTAIKQYDVNRVSVGMAVIIQSDGTGDAVYEGKLIRVAPMPISPAAGAAGGAGAGSDVKYEAVIEVTSQATDLKIGMSVRMDIVLDQKANVFAVPYDAVVENAAGVTVVYATVLSGDGKATSYREIPVTTGMETDFFIEVSGAELNEGMLIVSNPDAIPTEQIHA
jgi:multidrug efflux pump subunit AcrA (membrane-fusion protein)